MRDFILLQLRLAKTGANTVPLEKLKNFIGVYITQEEYECILEAGDTNG